MKTIRINNLYYEMLLQISKRKKKNTKTEELLEQLIQEVFYKG